MKKLMLAMAILSGFAPSVANAQQMPDVTMFKMMLEGNKQSGWVSFREYDGHQYVYFSALVTLRCRLKEIRYSINSDALDERFETVPCIPALPFALPSDAPWDATLLRLAPQTAKSVTVQVVFDDDTESEIVTFAPCEGVGDMTCAQVVS